jgi:hypothetical protein
MNSTFARIQSTATSNGRAWSLSERENSTWALSARSLAHFTSRRPQRHLLLRNNASDCCMCARARCSRVQTKSESDATAKGQCQKEGSFRSIASRQLRSSRPPRFTQSYLMKLCSRFGHRSYPEADGVADLADSVSSWPKTYESTPHMPHPPTDQTVDPDAPGYTLSKH